jgi:hypothetical protein
MVSIDHFRQELLVQLRRAATEGRIDILRASYVAPFRGIVPGQLLAAMPCKRSSSQEIRWFLIEPTERG